jgi:hypothetical protein|tara:strand:+ start:3609 stop:3959 length:351 start_codon:yes stop_codon:yes gene_type:complete
MKKFGNSDTVLPEDFFIRINPHLNSEGKWNGGIELNIVPNPQNPLDDDDYYQVEHICKMLCATLNFLEVEPSFRDKINNYVVNTIDKEDKESYKDTSKKVEYKDNIINVAFDKVSK